MLDGTAGRNLVPVNGRLSVDQAPRSLLIRQRVDTDADTAARSADTLAAVETKVVDDDNAVGEANANARGEDLLIQHLISSSPSANSWGLVHTNAHANLGIFRLRCHSSDPFLYGSSQ